MQCRKSHIPLVPRAANYSCSLTNRTVRKKFVSTQTDKCLSPFENWFQSSQITKEDVAFNEETTKAYSMALEYVNSFHSYMNSKLSEKYGECGDAKAGGTNFFKLPEVPNYSSIFFMLLEKTKNSTFTSNGENSSKKQENTVKFELEPKKYIMEDGIIQFVPEIKKMPEYQFLERKGALDEVKIVEQEVQTVISHQIDDESTSTPSKTVSDDLSSLASKHIHSIASKDGPELENEEKEAKGIIESSKKTCDSMQDIVQEDSTKKQKEVDKLIDYLKEPQYDTKTITTDMAKDDEKRVMMDIIRKRIQEEISTYLDCTTASMKNEQSPRLVKSHFHIINIPPQINLLEYAQKKLERQLISESRPMSRAGYPEALQKQYFNSSMCIKKPLNVTPNTPKRVTDMFQKFSQENFNRSLEETLMGDVMRCECDQSDGDSVILDDEEFQKINGHPEDQSDREQHRNSSVGREKSNPLKLTVRDMSKVNEKVLNTIGLFTERGDIRPEFIDILEEQKKAKAKDSRNKQFRSRRQWDLQIHLNPKQEADSSFTSVSTEKSFISLSSTDLKSDFETVKNVSQQVEYKE